MPLGSARRAITGRGVLAGLVLGALLAGGVAAASVSFDDVPSGKFYEAPAEWAKANNITTGSPAGSRTFKPEDPVTRGESVTFLKRYDDNVVQPALADRYTKAEVDALVGGLARTYGAAVAADGTLVDASPGITVGPHTPGSGTYVVDLPVDVSSCYWTATVGRRLTGSTVVGANTPEAAEISVITAVDWVTVPTTIPWGSPDLRGIRVGTRDSDGTPADHDFFLVVYCP